MRSRPIHYPKQAVNGVQTPASLAISVALRRARESRKVGLRAFARSRDIPVQYLSAWELGRRTPPIVTLAVLLTALKADATTVDRLLQLARYSEDPDLVDSHPGHHEETAWHYENLSTDTITWAPALLPDLLRTPAHEIHLANLSLSDPQGSDDRTHIVATRSRNLADRTRRYTFLIGETALRACPAYVYADQVEYLRTLANRPNVTIQIVPSDACPPGLISSFTAYQQDKITLAVAVRHHHATTYFSARDTLGQYHRTVRWLRGHALGVADAVPIGNSPAHCGADGRSNTGSRQNAPGSA